MKRGVVKPIGPTRPADARDLELGELPEQVRLAQEAQTLMTIGFTESENSLSGNETRTAAPPANRERAVRIVKIPIAKPISVELPCLHIPKLGSYQ
jgi:hypothetical protein